VLGDPLAAAPPTMPRGVLLFGTVGSLSGVPVVKSTVVPPGHAYLMATGAGPVMLWPSEGGRPWWRRALTWLATGARWAALPWWVPPA
jgi:hypothetical protein